VNAHADESCPIGTPLAVTVVVATSMATTSERSHVMIKRTIFGIAAVVLSSAPALAQSNDGSQMPAHRSEISGGLSEVPVAPTGLALQLGGGVTGFTRENARDSFGTGGYWDARAILGSQSFLGAELAYVGSAREVKEPGVSDTGALLGNGAEAVARVNLPLTAGSVQLTPFAFGGAGWTYYQIVNRDSNTSRMKDNANAFILPFGAGASLTYDHFVIDARFTYRAVFDDDLVPTGNGDNQDLQNWSAGLMLGYQL
jgi:hypothetical protein